MAEGLFKSFDPTLEVYSAGTGPAPQVSSRAIQVMKEIGIDISKAYPKHVDQFLQQSFDYVITVCDHARETCPVFLGDIKNQVHIGFEDPSFVIGTEDEILEAHRKVRDEMKIKLEEFYKENIQKNCS